ncbi:toprim domain-containing protein [Elusimicrobiota bacterium]
MDILRLGRDDFQRLTHAMQSARSTIMRCEICHNLSDTLRCRICADPQRNTSILCVVENTHDVEALENSGIFNGIYHVLHGSLAMGKNGNGFELPIGATVDDLFVKLKNSTYIKEVILALDQDSSGEFTSLFLSKEISQRTPDIQLTRIGIGVPFGGEILYADKTTLKHAFLSRIPVEK